MFEKAFILLFFSWTLYLYGVERKKKKIQILNRKFEEKKIQTVKNRVLPTLGDERESIRRGGRMSRQLFGAM